MSNPSTHPPSHTMSEFLAVTAWSLSGKYTTIVPSAPAWNILSAAITYARTVSPPSTRTLYTPGLSGFWKFFS